ncbi:amidohydrolase family protein [bacterium]|nr:amidohydrolase family protein [bacterium]
MKIYSANWVLPIVTPPIKNGSVVIDNDRIKALGPREKILKQFHGVSIADFQDGVILPGLVNAHTHLELSVMKNVIADGKDFGDWVYDAITKRFDFTPEMIQQACINAVHELENAGTVAVGDIANHSETSLAALTQSSLYAVIYNEVTGFSPSIARQRFDEFAHKIIQPSNPRIKQSLAPHAPYSVSADLFRLVGDFTKIHRLHSTVHLAESIDESEFLRYGTGKMKTMIEKIGKWDPAWPVPNASPVRYLDQLGFLNERLLAVHVVHVSDADVEILRQKNVSVCTCPRSNIKINVGGTAPIQKMINAGINVCIGTDSLASNDDLNMWNEMRSLRSIHPEIDAGTILTMATINGAHALGLNDRIGSIEIGKDNSLIAVTGSDNIESPENFLLSDYAKFKNIARLKS